MAIVELNRKMLPLTAEEALIEVSNTFGDKAVFTTSFGVEDQVITDIIFRNNLAIQVVTLDTGRLFEETYKVMNATRKKYGKEIKTYFPNTAAVEQLLSTKGPYSFYNSIEDRKACCNIRKVEPLNRALAGFTAWVTGIRAEQSSGRTELHKVEYDSVYNLTKVNPLLNWSLDDVMAYLNRENVPYNTLHHKGFISIGCAPCTRAVEEGEEFRAGRWWWEKNSGKECGLHVHK